MATRVDDTVLPRNFYSYCCACIDMERHGLTCFDEDGNYGGHSGEMIISRILTVFEHLEMFEDCAFLRDLLVKYKNKFHSAPESIPDSTVVPDSTLRSVN